MNSEEIDPKIHKNTGVKRVFKALFYSFDGLASSMKHEAAFRQEVLLAGVLIPASFLLNVPLAQHLALVASVLLVLIVELLNSAIEAVVDDISLGNRPLAKRAKDMGSAAVLLSLLNCLICWASVMILNWDRFFG
jgi:diacylglycerol kinase (ATP)